MRKIVLLVPALLCAAALLSHATAQPPGGKGGKGGKGKAKGGADRTSPVERQMAVGKNTDGKLTKQEVTDERLHRLFDQADANKDGTVTKEELEALAKKLDAEAGEGGGFGKGGPGGFGGRGKGGKGGPGGFGGPGGPGG